MKSYLKPLVILLPVIVVLSYFFVTYSNRSEFAEEDVKQAQEIAKGFENLELNDIQDWKGSRYIVKSTSEAIVVIHFWASWCAPCINEFPDLIQMAQSQNKKVRVFAISEDNSVDEIKAFIKSFRDAETISNFHIIWDRDHSFMKRWDVEKLPESFIYGPNRKLAKHVSGVVNWTNPNTSDYFKALENAVERTK